jgi:L-2,4-diaminobutyrate decarboxylase
MTTYPAVSTTRAGGVLTPDSRGEAAALLKELVDLGIGFKLDETLYQRRESPHALRDLIVHGLPDHSSAVEEVVDEIRTVLLPYCKNEASPRFLGFGDTGADIAALAGAIIALFTQQNLINQQFDAPSATFAEIAVLRWLRDLLGYTNPPTDQIADVWAVGGVITASGTMSNTVAMMLAREHAAPGTMTSGVTNPARMSLVVPRGIGHYSVKSALAWIGAGDHLVEVETVGYRYDLRALARALDRHAGSIMGVVAYAGDSRTQTIDNLAAVRDLVRSSGQKIWLHADACWGLMAALHPSLRAKLSGIEDYDSVTVDPHKVLNIPYSLSALLVRQLDGLRAVSSYSDLIMQEDYALGQITPLVGSRGWSSLMLWTMMRAHGRAGLADLMAQRLDITRQFVELVDADPRLQRLHDPDLTAVAFCFLPSDHDALAPDIERLAAINRRIHQRILSEGQWHFHQFSLPDDTGTIKRGATLRPLRFMATNPRITPDDLRRALDYVTTLGLSAEKEA